MNAFQKPQETDLRRKLTPEQYKVTQQCGTEPPFRNAYWDNKKPGIYVDVVSGEPLFSSMDKYDSGSGWPSFTQPIEGTDIVEKKDLTHGMVRVEVRSKSADSHLGHVFDDGPGPTRQRYCINSASLRFVPVERMAEEGFGALLGPFVKAGLIPLATAATAAGKSAPGTRETAILAGGCFWGMEEILRKIPGVLQTTVGYTGGSLPNPTYKQVCTGQTGHAEAIEIVYDPAVTDFRALLEFFFQIHDPTTVDRQGNDVGSSYRSAIFYLDDEQRRVAADTIADVDASGLWPGPVVTEVTPAAEFWDAEPEHQDYLLRFPGGYTCHYPRPGWTLPRRAQV